MNLQEYIALMQREGWQTLPQDDLRKKTVDYLVAMTTEKHETKLVSEPKEEKPKKTRKKVSKPKARSKK